MSAKFYNEDGLLFTFSIMIDDGSPLEPPTLTLDTFARKGLDNTARVPTGKRERPKTYRIVHYETTEAFAEDFMDDLTALINQQITFDDNFGRRWQDVWVVDVRHVSKRPAIRISEGDTGTKVQVVSEITLARTTTTQSTATP